jgi:hypothetical protein
MYFLVKDYYDAKKIDVEFCPADEMWADVMTNRSSETCEHSYRTVQETTTMAEKSSSR